MGANTPQSLLPVVIRTGFILLLTALIIELIIFMAGWPLKLSALAIVLVVLGLYFLIVAWHIRQGLVHGRLVRRTTNLINWIKRMKTKI